MKSVTAVSGTIVDTDDPDLDGVTLEDVFHALSLLQRWHGSTRVRFTVADHILAGLPIARDYGASTAVAWLMHETGEALACGDIPSPLRTRSFDRVEDRLLKAACWKWGVTWPLPREMWTIDRRMARTEVVHLLHPYAASVIYPEVAPYEMELRPTAPAQARKELLRAAKGFGL